MSLNINYKFDEQNKFWDVSVNGEVDIYTAKDLKEKLTKMIEEKKEDIRIDIKDLDYIDSTGLGVIIGSLGRLREDNKRIRIINAKKNVAKLLNITGLDKIFNE